MGIKKKSPLIVLSLLVVATLSFVFWNNLNNQKTSDNTEQTRNLNNVKEFNENLVPLYLQKITILKKYFKTEKEQGDMTPFINLSKNWTANNMEEVETIIELAGYLDQKMLFSLNQLDKKKRMLITKELEPIEREIRKLDQPFLTKILSVKKNKH